MKAAGFGWEFLVEKLKSKKIFACVSVFAGISLLSSSSTLSLSLKTSKTTARFTEDVTPRFCKIGLLIVFVFIVGGVISRVGRGTDCLISSSFIKK